MSKLIREFSAGGILFRRDRSQRLLFLLVYSARNKIWGFPKGHIEPGETELQAGLREIKEETGILEGDVSQVAGFKEEDVYAALSHRPPHQGQAIEKHSVYFLFETKKISVSVDGGEITRHRWVTIEEAKPLVGFDSLYSILGKAYKEAQRPG